MLKSNSRLCFRVLLELSKPAYLVAILTFNLELYSTVPLLHYKMSSVIWIEWLNWHHSTQEAEERLWVQGILSWYPTFTVQYVNAKSGADIITTSRTTHCWYYTKEEKDYASHVNGQKISEKEREKKQNILLKKPGGWMGLRGGGRRVWSYICAFRGAFKLIYPAVWQIVLKIWPYMLMNSLLVAISFSGINIKH